MKLKEFASLVELRTKVASLVPFIIGVLFAYYRYDNLIIINSIIMLLSLLCIDMATTAINNCMDFLRANKKHGYNFETHNAIVNYDLSKGVVLLSIMSLLSLGVVLGLALVLLTDVVVLMVGICSFGVGILYSFGPLPISRTPLGEVFSGVFMGFLILFLSIYVNVFDEGLIVILFKPWHLTVNLDLLELFIIGCVSVPIVLGISNIMLANNICDIEDDEENKRFTLPIYIGKRNAIHLFNTAYVIAFIFMLGISIVRMMPLVMLLSTMIFIPIYKNVLLFNKLQSKKETFSTAVVNFVLIGIAYIFSLAIGIALKIIV